MRKALEGYLQQRREQACRLRVLTQSRSASHGESPPQSGHGDDLCTVTYLQLTRESLDFTFRITTELWRRVTARRAAARRTGSTGRPLNRCHSAQPRRRHCLEPSQAAERRAVPAWPVTVVRRLRPSESPESIHWHGPPTR